MSPDTTREDWLQAATSLLNDRVFRPVGYDVPSDVQVSCSWPGGGSARKRIGECWARRMSSAGVNEVFVSPSIADSIRVLDILAHELIHAIDDCQNGHKGPFKRIAVAIGLEGKMTATHAGEALKQELTQLVAMLGDYPHDTLNLADRKKQTTRMKKVECYACSAVWRASQTVAMDMSTCPVCQSVDIQVHM